MLCMLLKSNKCLQNTLDLRFSFVKQFYCGAGETAVLRMQLSERQMVLSYWFSWMYFWSHSILLCNSWKCRCRNLINTLVNNVFPGAKHFIEDPFFFPLNPTFFDLPNGKILWLALGYTVNSAITLVFPIFEGAQCMWYPLFHSSSYCEHQFSE